MADIRAGSDVGGYILDVHIGGGSFGTVWRGHEVTSGRQVAVKLLTGNLSSSDSAGMRADLELLAAEAARRSEHVVHVLGGGTEPVPYIVMEFIEGEDLSSLLATEGHLSVEQTIEVGFAIADALRALNEAGIIHRDIKPANVMIDREGTIKLADFGIAKIVGYETMTMTGQAAMTMAYAAPEVWDDSSDFGPPSHRSDLYALGVLLYQCLTGETPFRGNYGALYKAHTERPPDINALPAETPASLRDLIRRCLEKRQENRPRSAAECVAILERAKAEFAGASSSTEPRQFGRWLREAAHETVPWAWRCRHETSGDHATVEVVFSDDLNFAGELRKAVAASEALAPLGAERLIETNRLLLHPGEAWLSEPPGRFQFWVAREDRDLGSMPSVSVAAVRTAAHDIVRLLDGASEQGLPLTVAGNLMLATTGEIYLRRPGLDLPGDPEPEESALASLRSLPLENAAAALLRTMPDLRTLAGAGSASSHVTAVAGSETVFTPATTVFAPPVARAAEPAGAVAVATVRPQLVLTRSNEERGMSTYELAVTNPSAVSQSFLLTASDRANALAFSMPRTVMVSENGSARVRFNVTPQKPRRFGGRRTYRFTIAAGGGDSGQPPVTVEGEFSEEPSMVPMFAAAGVLGIALVAVLAVVVFASGGSSDSNKSDKDKSNAAAAGPDVGATAQATAVTSPTAAPEPTAAPPPPEPPAPPPPPPAAAVPVTAPPPAAPPVTVPVSPPVVVVAPPVPAPAPAPPPPPPPASASYSFVGFADHVGASNNPPGDITAPGGAFRSCSPGSLYAWVRFSNLQNPAQFVGNWTLNGTALSQRVFQQTDASGTSFWQVQGSPQPLTAGNYRFQLTVNGNIVSSGNFTLTC